MANFPLVGAFLSERAGAGGVKRTSAVPPPSPAPEQVSKRRNGDTARTVRRSVRPALRLPASRRARPGVQGTGLALSQPPGEEENLPSASALFTALPLLRGLANPAVPCVRSPHEQECTSAH